jgi:hypothetical protein
MKPNKFNIKLFRFSAILGLTTCWVLNLMWCYFLLRIIPQKINPIYSLNSSLERAESKGQTANMAIVGNLNIHFRIYFIIGIK